MPKYRLTAEIVEAAATHGEEAHGTPFPPEVIGRPRSRSNVFRVTWAEDPQLGLFIRCRDCPDGFDRYFVEVERLQPTQRLLKLIGAHFARLHPDVEFRAERVWHEGQRAVDPLATFMPVTPHHGASIICKCCPEGEIWYLTPAPYSDVRRLRLLLIDHPELRTETRGFSSRQQADYVEAWDRDLLNERDPNIGRRALEQARAQRKQEPSQLDTILRTILRERVIKGTEGITQVVNDLESQSREDATGFACTIGLAVPELAAFRSTDTDQQFATRVATFLISFPTVASRHLWDLWGELKRERDQPS